MRGKSSKFMDIAEKLGSYMGSVKSGFASDMAALEVSVEVEGVAPEEVVVDGVSTLLRTARRTWDAYFASLDSDARAAQMEWMEWRSWMREERSSKLYFVVVSSDDRF